MDRVDRELLDRLQEALPLVSRPFAALGRELGLAEPEVLERVARLHDRGLIRRLGPVLDPEKLGRVGALAAMAVPRGRLEGVAAQVSAHEQVTHNYERQPIHGQCPYNLWFTLTAESDDALAQALARIAEATGLPVAAFPARRRFKIGVRFSFAAEPEDG